MSGSTRRTPYPSCTWTVARSPARHHGSPSRASASDRSCVDQVAITAPDASLSPSPAGPTLDYNRPPRLHPAAQPNEFSLPQEPRRPDKMPFPLTMMLMPVVMSGAMYFVTRAWYTLLFAAAMPLMMLANASGSRRQQKKRYLEQVKEYEERRVRTEKAAVTSLVGERGTRRRNFPDPATVLLFATGPRARLWERRPWDRDFLHLRIGTTDLPSDVTIKDPTREVHEGPLLWTAPDVPVTIPLREVGVVGIAGSPERAARSRCGRWPRSPRCTALPTRWSACCSGVTRAPTGTG